MTQKPKLLHSWSITILFMILTVIGMANLYSAGTDSLYFSAQLKHTILGLLIFLIVGWLTPIRHLNTYSYPYFVFICLCLLVVLVLGHTAGGAQRWIKLGPLRFQPSEFAKLAVVMATAKFFYLQRSLPVFTIKDLSPILIANFLVFALIFKQPDFGTAGLCLIIAAAQISFIRIEISFKAILSMVVGSLAMAVIGWTFLLRPYQKLRVLNLLYPNLDPSGSGYNSLQSLVAIGSGKQFGKGFLQGTQTQLQFLPARHTDFIFSVFAEEHGFWGCALIFVMFAAIAYIALEIARESKDSFCSLVAIGVAAIIFAEFTINIAMVVGIFPVVGMPLPFFSYGGSALLTICISMGLLVAIDKENAKSSRSSKLMGL